MFEFFQLIEALVILYLFISLVGKVNAIAKWQNTHAMLLKEIMKNTAKIRDTAESIAFVEREIRKEMKGKRE